PTPSREYSYSTLILHRALFPFFFTPTAPTEIYTLSLHDALPIYHVRHGGRGQGCGGRRNPRPGEDHGGRRAGDRGLLPADLRRRSEEHTSELQSRFDLVCRLLLEKKK